MSRTFLLVDSNHLFNRAKYVVKGSVDEIAGLCLHTIFQSIGKIWRIHSSEHIHLVLSFDGNSWRKKIYAPYKANRAVKKLKRSAEEVIDDEIFYEAFAAFKKFIEEHTNCTVLYHPELESDDNIAGFIQSHPDDRHIIVSSDKDFEQLLADNVTMYNGIADQTITINGIFDYRNKPVKDKKTGNDKLPPDPKWSLFEKAVRGCSSDNVFAAYPGAREKGTKNKVGMREAFADKDKQGFSWSAFMLTRWMDHENIEHRVLDDYKRNMILVDLANQPADIKSLINETITNASIKKANAQIGIHFLKFCGKYQLQKLSEQAEYFAKLLSVGYE